MLAGLTSQTSKLALIAGAVLALTHAPPVAADMSPEMQKLVAEANKDGTLNVTWSQDVLGGASGQKIFEKNINAMFGTKLSIHYAPGASMAATAHKIASEIAAGKASSTDLYIGPGPFAQVLTSRNGFQAYDWQKLLPGRITSDMAEEDNQVVRFATGFPGVTYNTQLVPKDKVPERLTDFLQPFWKGKIASTVYAAGFEAISSTDRWGPDKAIDYIKKLSGQVSGLLRCGDGERIATGEYAAMVMDCSPQQADEWKARGAPVDHAIMLDAAQRRFWYLGVPKNAPHKAAAALYVAYAMTSEGQQTVRKTWLVDLDTLPDAPDHDFAPKLEKKGAKFLDITIDYLNKHPEMDKAKDPMVKALRASQKK